MDRETVITHLQIIHTWAEFARERDLQFFTKKHLEDIAEWSSDAIVMLKEQEDLGTELTYAVESIRRLQKDKDKLCIEVSEWKHKYHDTLKEQANEYENGFNDAMLGKQGLMYEGTDGKWHKKDW